MHDWLTAIILGFIEGLTEFLPISSTGHLLLAEHWLTPQSDLFNTVIQSGAVLAVLTVFRGRLQQLFLQWQQPDTRRYISQLVVAFGITGAGGLWLKKMHFKLPETTVPIAWATLIGGVMFLVIEYGLRYQTKQTHISWQVAIAMGLAQLVAAVFPGTSRSGATILAGLLLGVNRQVATEFSFLLGVPTLLAASFLQIVLSFKEPEHQTAWPLLVVATIVAACVAFIVVRWLLLFIQNHSFVIFAWYRIALGILLLTLF